MDRAWIHKSGLIAIGVLTVGAILTGCSSNPPLPLTLNTEPVTAYLDEEIVVALDNPTMSVLFVPAAWTGLAIYRTMVPETWSEYLYPDEFQPMLTTTKARVQYSIPAGSLEPGSYKLVLQGRFGKDGTPFSLEVNFYVMSFSMSQGFNKIPGGAYDRLASQACGNRCPSREIY